MRLLFLTIISSIFFTSAQDSTTKEDFFKSGVCISGDCKIDFGVKKFNDGTVYFGSWWNDLPSGHGTIIWSDGTIYVGNFLDGEYHGDGTYMTPQQFYIGEFKNDVVNGNGSFFTTNGVYVGEFYNGLYEGKGFFLNRNGEISEGKYLKGNIVGNLTYKTDGTLLNK